MGKINLFVKIDHETYLFLVSSFLNYDIFIFIKVENNK